MPSLSFDVRIVSTILAFAASTSNAVTWHIEPDGTGDAPTIQAAIYAAAAGDTVELACGTFHEHRVTMKSGVTLRSETGNSNCATIDAESLGPTLLCIDQSGPLRVEGLTISGGLGDAGPDSAGGGFVCRDSEPTISDCRFIGNTSAHGAGAGVHGGSPRFERCVFQGNVSSSAQWATGGGLTCLNASPVLVECSFIQNTAFSTAFPGDGGGVFSESSDLEAVDCLFQENSSGAGGGGLYSFQQDQPVLTGCVFQGNSSGAGGAIYLEASSAQTIDCTFLDNTATTGGAIYTTAWSFPEVRGCTFTSNEATPYSGGAIGCWHSVPLIEECSFQGNSTALDGGAVASNGVCRPTFRGCEFFGNSSGRNGGAMSGYYATTVNFDACTLVENSSKGVGGAIFQDCCGALVLERTIVAFSSGEAVVCVDSSPITVSCSDVHGNSGGDWVNCLTSQGDSSGNFSADPLFCDPGGGDRSLAGESPCLPPNNSCGVLVGALPQGCVSPVSVGEAIEPLSWAAIKSRYRAPTD